MRKLHKVSEKVANEVIDELDTYGYDLTTPVKRDVKNTVSRVLECYTFLDSANVARITFLVNSVRATHQENHQRPFGVCNHEVCIIANDVLDGLSQFEWD